MAKRLQDRRTVSAGGRSGASFTHLDRPEDTRPKWWMEELVGDDIGHPSQSVLQLRINGRKMGPAHSYHEAIRKGKTTGFSHWKKWVIFSLPPGAKNDPTTIASLQYSVRPPAWATFALNVLSGILGWFLYGEAIDIARATLWRTTDSGGAGPPYLILLGLFAAPPFWLR